MHSPRTGGQSARIDNVRASQRPIPQPRFKPMIGRLVSVSRAGFALPDKPPYNCMVDNPETQPGQSMPAGAATVDEAQIIHDIVRRTGWLREGIQEVRFRFGEDSEGAPAVWITFVTNDDLKPSKEKIAALQRISNEVRSEIVRSGSERWPYIEISTE